MTTTAGLPPVPATLAGTVEVARSARAHVGNARRVGVTWQLVGLDVVAAAGAGTLAQAAHPSWSATVVALAVLVWLVSAALSGAYGEAKGLYAGGHARALLRAAGGTALVAWPTVALVPTLAPGSLNDGARGILLFVVAAPAASFVLRTARRALVGAPRMRVLLVGNPAGLRPLLEEAGREASTGRRAPLPVAVCVSRHDSTREDLELLDAATDLTIWQSDELLEAVRTHHADAVIVAPGAHVGHAELRRWGSWLQDEGVQLLVSSGLRDVAPARVDISTLGGLRLLHVRPAAISGLAYRVKTLVDRLAAGLLLLLLAPLLATVAVLIRLDSPGRAIYTQTRVGRNGHHFTVFKFRTMRQGSDEALEELVDVNESDANGVLFKIRRDPRITRLGAFLRKYSIDELPQLINVVRGEMSLIGPRPALPREVRAYSADLQRRLVVKPGMTGLWQVSGRSDLSWDDTVRLDLAYVDNWSWGMDLRLAILTIGAVIGHRGAY